MITQAIKVLSVFLLSFGSAIALTPIIFKLLLKFGIKKQIKTSETAPVFSALHAKKAGTPTMGGIIIWASVLIVLIITILLAKLFGGRFEHLNFISRSETYLPLAAFFFAAIIGLADDILGVLRIGPKGGGLSMRLRLGVYAIMGAIGAWWFYSPKYLDWHILHVPFLGNFDIGFWYVPFFIFIIVASAFSANETDGLDGLLGGVSIFAFGALGAIAFYLGRYDLSAMTAAIIGALIAFLWYNIHPAKFFMGDTGSMSLGITMGMIALLTNTALLLPLIAFVPMMESLSVIVQKTHKLIFKRKLFHSTPIHHHFEAIGMPETQITMKAWVISLVFSAAALILFLLEKAL